MANVEWTHTRAEWLLIDIGRRTGHTVWLAAGDRDRVVGAVRLGDITLDRLPTTLPEPVRHGMEHIDVIWFPRGETRPTALFEVEHSTSVITGMLRMNDLLVSIGPAPEGWAFHIVAPARRFSRFETERVRPTFRASGLADRISFISYDELADRHRRVSPDRRY